VDKISAATGLTQEEIEGLCKAIYLKARRSWGSAGAFC
jgi:hypothetical protein